MDRPEYLEISLSTRIRLGLYKDITDVTFATVLEWFKKEGDVIGGITDQDTEQVSGENLCNIKGAKGIKIVEALSSEMGRRIKKILVPAGKTVTFDLRKGPLRLAELEDADGVVKKILPVLAEVSPIKKVRREEVLRISPAAKSASEKLGIAQNDLASDPSRSDFEVRVRDVLRLESDLLQKRSGVSSDVILASPAVRKTARELGIDLKEVIPTGRGGIILPRDLSAHSDEKKAESSGEADTDADADADADADEDIIIPDAFRLTVALNVQHAVNGNFNPGRGLNIPIAGDGVDINVEALAMLRKKLKSVFQAEDNAVLGFESFFLAATAKILREERFKLLNSCWEWLEDRSAHIVRFRHINLAIPVAGPSGLMMPVLKNCESKSFRDIVKIADELVKKAIAGRLSEEEQEGFTFTVNNSGSLGGEDPTPIMPMGTGVIVAFGHIRDNKTMRINIRFDHRLFDGHHIIPFLMALKDLLEFPEKILYM